MIAQLKTKKDESTVHGCMNLIIYVRCDMGEGHGQDRGRWTVPLAILLSFQRAQIANHFQNEACDEWD